MRKLDGLAKSLAPAFNGLAPSFVTDSNAVNAALKANGLRSFLYEEVPEVEPDSLANVVAVPVTFSATPPGHFIEKHFGNSAMLVVPIASFCGTDDGAIYMLEKLATAEIPACVAGVQYWLDRLESAESLRFVGAGTDITVELGDEVCLMTPKADEVIVPGEWTSIAQYLEVGLITSPDLQRPAHEMNGIFVAEGVVVAHHRRYWTRIKSTADMVWNYLTELRKRNGFAPVIVEVEASRPLALRCGRESVLDEVLTFVDPDDRSYISEFGFASSTQWDLNETDWTVNSQLNEAIGGLHIGLGRGVTGAHIDLVAPQAVLS